MEALLFAVCEAVNTRNSRLDLLGVYDVLGADGEPMRMPLLRAILKGRFRHEEEGQHFVYHIRITDADGKVVIEDKCLVQVPVGSIPEGKYMIQHHIFELEGAIFSRFGEYSVDLLVSGELVRQWPLAVVPRTNRE